MISKKPILVTGSHRSGTTWVGKMLSISPDVFYITEPFNPNNDFSLGFENWFQYISKNNEHYYKKDIVNLLNLNYEIFGKFKQIDNLDDFRTYIGLSRQYLINKLFQSRLLIKDPIAFFSAEWLATTFDMNVVITIRHPAAFVGSLKKAKNWRFDYNNFLKQPLLMEKYLSSFRDRIEEYSINPPNRIQHGIFLYKIFCSIIKEYQKKYPKWIFLRHEDLSLNPCNSFRELYEKLGLKYSDKIANTIYNYTHREDELDKNIHLMQISRNSYSNISSWQSRLTELEISKVKLETYEVARLFYSDNDWNLKLDLKV